jgi:hypothetical protein
LKLKDKIQVRDYGNIQNLTPYLKDFIQKQEFIEKVTALGIIRDAEDKPATSAFQSVCSSLTSAKITQPNKIGEAQQCVMTVGSQSQDLKVGVFILPDCQEAGMIEDLCLRSLNDDAMLGCVEDYFICLEPHGIKPKNIAKAKTWTFLSALGEFDPQVGRAAQKNIWDWDGQTFQPLVFFLKALCSE